MTLWELEQAARAAWRREAQGMMFYGAVNGADMAKLDEAVGHMSPFADDHDQGDGDNSYDAMSSAELARGM